GHRALIVEPTKTLRSQVREYVLKEDPNAAVHESKAWNDYQCPIIEMAADPSLCSVRKEICRQEKRGCGVLKDIDDTRQSNLTVATFAKMLLSKGMFQNYTDVFIDESHGFENAETSFLQSYVLLRKIDQVADEMQTGYPHVSSKLRALSKGLTRLNQMTGDSSILTPMHVIMIS